MCYLLSQISLIISTSCTKKNHKKPLHRYSSGCGARTPKPSARVFVHGVVMRLMRLVGALSQHKPWYGPKLLRAMVAVKNEKKFLCKRLLFSWYDST